MSIEDYHKQMEISMIWANIEEDWEATMAHFFRRLNKEIVDIVELHHYVEMEDMVNMGIEVERQMKEKKNTCINWRFKWPKKEKEAKIKKGI